MIISASRRSDIPAFYGEWLVNRLRAGEVLVRNPMQPKQVSRIILSPETVDALVFWTKNPAPFLSRLPEIDALSYSYYFLFTLTPYDLTLEPGVPQKASVVEVFRKLSRLIGPEKVVWRYDPVVLSDLFTPDWHAAAFSRLAEELSGLTERCVISFFDDYSKVRKRMQGIRYYIPDTELMGDLAGRFSDMARRNAIELFTCSQDIDLSRYGIQHSRCIDSELVQRITGSVMTGMKKDSRQRKSCGCIESRDIGRYNTCAHGCLYCYAVSSHFRACSTLQAFDPLSPILCDSLRGDETITTSSLRKYFRRTGHEQNPGLPQDELFPMPG
ncbi:MAG: DUF1848 domain-containing protein [Chlorobiaceae bacterium]|jgi:hypothetical protein|nr:DUF1848 domain-containing protein [Chlorobiaceae bacterium]NTV17330.1 DUF1848 domain-containing protein [Chlorobiaceae bacterium]